MPRISAFYGIVIAMFYGDHEPAHFHATYAEFRAVIGVNPVWTVEGFLPPRALTMVYEWAAAHQIELQEDWVRARERRPLLQIAPLV